MGILSPLGLDITANWEGLIAGKSGVDYMASSEKVNFGEGTVEVSLDLVPAP